MQNTIIITVNSSFYPNQSYLISAYFVVVVENTVLVKGRFIKIVALDYYHTYLVELYNTLLIFKLSIAIIPKNLDKK